MRLFTFVIYQVVCLGDKPSATTLPWFLYARPRYIITRVPENKRILLLILFYYLTELTRKVYSIEEVGFLLITGSIFLIIYTDVNEKNSSYFDS